MVATASPQLWSGLLRSAATRADLALLANTSHLPCLTGGGAGAGTTKCEACAQTCGTTTRCERAHYSLPDGSGDIILARYGHTFNYSARAKGGEWSPSGATNLPDIGANLNTVSAAAAFSLPSPLLTILGILGRGRCRTAVCS